MKIPKISFKIHLNRSTHLNQKFFKNIDVKTLIENFDRYQLQELSFRYQSVKIKMTKQLPQKFQTQTQNPSPKPQTHTQNVQTPSKPQTPPPTQYHQILSPMAGNFYRAPGPLLNPYVQVGTHIHPDSTLCIIEAMKTMNEIKAEVSGQIVQILPQNAEGVSLGQTLFLIDLD